MKQLEEEGSQSTETFLEQMEIVKSVPAGLNAAGNSPGIQLLPWAIKGGVVECSRALPDRGFGTRLQNCNKNNLWPDTT